MANVKSGAFREIIIDRYLQSRRGYSTMEMNAEQNLNWLLSKDCFWGFFHFLVRNIAAMWRRIRRRWKKTENFPQMKQNTDFSEQIYWPGKVIYTAIPLAVYITLPSQYILLFFRYYPVGTDWLQAVFFAWKLNRQTLHQEPYCTSRHGRNPSFTFLQSSTDKVYGISLYHVLQAAKHTDYQRLTEACVWRCLILI